MLAIDASRVAPDYSYAAVVPRGAQVFAVGWNPDVGVLLMYSAVPTGPEEIPVDEVVRLWFVPLESIEACAPVGAAYLGTVRVASDVAMCVFLELDRE